MKLVERAWQVWPLLVYCAAQRQVLSYDQLAKLSGMARQGLGGVLEPIQSYCLVHNLPPLTVLVVSADSGMPGEGFIAAQNIPKNQAAVFSYDWAAHKCPPPDEFQRAVEQLPSNGIADAARNAYEK